MRLFSIIICFLMFSNTGIAAQSLEGSWHGAGVQIDGLDWPMTVEIEDGIARVDYPSLECGGHWDFIKSSDEHIMAIERITYGVNECLDGGLIRAEVYVGYGLKYEWFDKSGKTVASSILLRGEYNEAEYDSLLDLTMQAVGNYFIEGPTARIDMGDGKI